MRWWIIAMLAGCYAPTPARGIPCSTSGNCPEGQSCDLNRGLCSPVASDVDAPPGDVALLDGLVADPGAPWSTPHPITNVNTADVETDPALSADGLELFFASDRNGGNFDLFRATRAATSDPFGAPTMLFTLGSPSDEYAPDLASDGLTLYFRRGGDIYHATRAGIGQPFQNIQRDTELSSSSTDTNPSISADLLVATATRDLTATHRALYLFERATPASPWGPARQIAELLTTGIDSGGWLDQHGLAMYFHSDRPGGVGADDVWFTARPSTGVPFLPPVLIGSLSTDVEESDPSLDGSGTIIVFERATQIFIATR